MEADVDGGESRDSFLNCPGGLGGWVVWQLSWLVHRLNPYSPTCPHRCRERGFFVSPPMLRVTGGWAGDSRPSSNSSTSGGSSSSSDPTSSPAAASLVAPPIDQRLVGREEGDDRQSAAWISQARLVSDLPLPPSPASPSSSSSSSPGGPALPCSVPPAPGAAVFLCFDRYPGWGVLAGRRREAAAAWNSALYDAALAAAVPQGMDPEDDQAIINLTG